MTDVSGLMDRFRGHLMLRGLRLTEQRQVIAEAFFGAGRHLSLTDIQVLTRGQRDGIGFATVYRTMRLLVEAALAAEHKFGEDQTLYEPSHEGEHHDHLICVDCGRIIEFEEPAIEALQERVAAERGYEVVSHRHEVYVRCVHECEEKVGRGADPGVS